MADHLREQIMDALATNLTGLTTTGANVTRLRVYPEDPGNLPSLNLMQGDDVPIDDEDELAVYNRIDRRLDITIEARVQSATVQLDQTLNLIAKEVAVALHADITQGVSGVINTIEGVTIEPRSSAELEKKTAQMDMLYTIHYRTSRTNPSVAA